MFKNIIICAALFSISVFSAIIPAEAQYQYEDQPELISLDIRGMDINDVLKILSQKSGLNIVADKDVKGMVSLYVKDVNVMDALDIIVSTNGLAYEEEGTLVRVMTDRTYEKLHGASFEDQTRTKIIKLNYVSPNAVAAVLSKMSSKIGNIIADDASNTIVLIDNAETIEEMSDLIENMDVALVTEVFSLDYANAEAIRDKLEKMLSGNIGSIKFDERTNKIIVRDTPKKLQDMREVIEAFDEKTREVIIDANIIKVTLSDKYSYGIDWSDIASLGDVTLTGETNLTTSLSGTASSTLTIATAQNYTTVISLLKTYGSTDVLSRPRITVADRQEAKILVGAKEVYVTTEITTTSGGTYHTTDHVNFVDVGVRLSVTPEINKEGYVRLKIKPEVSDTDATKTVTLTNPDGSTRSIIPYVTTSEAETTVLVKDNTTLILGGLMKDTVTEYNEKVPFLGDIPILGKLFSTSGKGKEKTELVIFLTPHIIEGDKPTEETQFYVGEWGKKMKNAEIKKPEEPGVDLSKPSKEKEKKVSKTGPAPAAKAVKKPASKPEAETKTKTWKEKWTPILLGVPPKEKEIERLEKKERLAVSERKAGKESPYERYYLTVRKEINSMVKRQDVSGLKGEVELQFTLDKEGFLTRGPIVLNNPDLKLVRAAVNCVKMASPFSPFPKEMKRKDAEFYVVVRFE